MPAPSKIFFYTVGISLTLFFAGACLFHSEKIDFNSQVKPIINKRCITCHGGVRAKGGFSLLFREEAFAKTASGSPAIIAGDPDHSEMIRRLTLKDPEDRMPYKHEPLTKEEIDILREWVREGAPWGQHWAYIPVAAPVVPAVKDGWVRNNIDRYILEKLEGEKLEGEKLEPAGEAPAPDLLRRVSLDLTGLYPTDAVARQFLESKNPHAYETLVDTLLASPHFGEKWTAMWLDLARYADTKGYERDDSRNIWRYRDWLIRAFNSDMPYDRFLTEQLAGDLLPNPDDAKYIATAFHRNTMTNDEGGTENEEFRTAAVLDRVNTTWEALMGTTFACTQCHSHPYDPFHHDEYYRFMAYFNDTRDEDSQADYPLLRSFNDTDKVKLDSLIAWVSREAGLDRGAGATVGRQAGAARAASIRKLVRTWQPSINSLTADHFVNSELNDTKWLALRQNGVARLAAVDLGGGVVGGVGGGKDWLIYRWQTFVPGGSWSIHLDRPDGPVLGTAQPGPTKDWTIASLDLRTATGGRDRGATGVFDRGATGVFYRGATGVHDLYLTYSNPKLTVPDASGIMFDWFCFTQHFPGDGQPGYAANKELFWSLLTKDVPTTPVMMDNPSDMHRVSNVFERGNWLVKGAVVTPGVPASLSSCMPAGAPANRLGLAMWMTSKQNPLVARTMVNRVWEQLFGTGIVETLEDLGSQGSPPTHQALLDYLAWQYMNADGWSLKRLLKEIVMSATYREDSKVTPASLKADPFNRLLSRGSRVRLSAEQLRDQALCICGQYNPTMYGPSVFPYQPKGIWMSPWNGAEWVVNKDGGQYRRALYTYWKRTASYPSMISFDATSRENCTARRIRTNTPLQALVTLNDSAYLDMARHFARRMDSLRPGDPAAQIEVGWKCMLYKPIEAGKLKVLMGLYADALARFTAAPKKAGEMLGGPGSAAGAGRAGSGAESRGGAGARGDDARQAALVVVANALLNLDEIITKN